MVGHSYCWVLFNHIKRLINFHKKTSELMNTLGKALNTLFQWFKDNFLKGNPDKYHLTVDDDQTTKVNIGEFNEESSDHEKLLRAKTDNKLMLNCHFSDIWKNASRKINAQARLAA